MTIDTCVITLQAFRIAQREMYLIGFGLYILSITGINERYGNERIRLGD
jgi:hypothetical protein